MVTQYCFRMGLYRQGILHDLSKYSPAEFIPGACYYQGFRSPHNAQREETGAAPGWLHHKGRNLHHFEHWVDYSLDKDDERVLFGTKMPRRYVAEMVADRIGASRNYLGSAYTPEEPLKYWMRAKDRIWFIHPQTAKELEGLLTLLARHGEDKTIWYIRNVYLKKGKRREKKGWFF